MNYKTFAIVLLAGFVPSADAQFCSPGDEVCRVQSANYRLLDSNRHRGWYQQDRADLETAVRMIFRPNMGWGYYGNSGGFIAVPGYIPNGGRAARVGQAVERGAAGAMIGYGVTGTTRGAAIGGGIGLAADIIVSAAFNRNSGGKTKKIDCGKKKLKADEQAACVAAEAEAAPVWHFNHTRLRVDVYDGDPTKSGTLVCQLDSQWESSCRTGPSHSGGFVGLIQVYDASTGRYTPQRSSIRPSADRDRQGNVYQFAPRQGGV